jgi:hypothetical protein
MNEKLDKKVSPPFEGGMAGAILNYVTNAHSGRGG